MPRRTATMLASALVLIALLCAGVLIKVPYSEMSPGPTVNTLGEARGEPVLQISGRKTYPASGHLNMTTVRVTGADYRMNIFEAVYGWLAHDSVVVPLRHALPGRQDRGGVHPGERRGVQPVPGERQGGRSEGTGHPGLHAGRGLHGGQGQPSEGKLHAGDVIKAVDGTAVKEPDDVAKLVTEHRPGENVTFTIVPAKEAAAAEKAGRDSRGRREGHDQDREGSPAEEEGKDRAIVGIREPGRTTRSRSRSTSSSRTSAGRAPG